MISIDNVALVEVLKGKIEAHIDTRDDIFVPQKIFCQEVAKYGGSRRENRIKSQDQKHGTRDISVGLERKSTIEGEIPKDAQQQGNQIAWPILPGGELVEKCERANLDDSGAGGKEDKLEDT